MSTSQTLVNLLAYAAFSFGTLLIWPSRKNLIAWLALPFFVVAYVIPLAVVDYHERASDAAIELLTGINLMGALGFLVGIVLGGHFMAERAPRASRCWVPPLNSSGFSNGLIFKVMLLSCLLMSACFAWMGMVPLFADDPFLAKFFRGEYKEKYDQISTFYRFSQAVITTILPIAMSLCIERRSRRLVLVVGWAVLLLAVSLNRGSVVYGAVMLTAAWASRRRARLFWFLVVTTLIYCLGSSVYVVLGLSTTDDFNLLAEIARGAPDVADHLAFLDAFNPARDLSYGLTFVGGLIPGNFYFNPSVFTLAIVNGGADVSEIASGGFRLPPSVSGYMAFAWPGAFLVPLLSGAATGYFTRLLRSLPTRSLTEHVSALVWFQIYASFWIMFYAMPYAALVSMAILMFVSMQQRRHRTAVPVGGAARPSPG